MIKGIKGSHKNNICSKCLSTKLLLVVLKKSKPAFRRTADVEEDVEQGQT